MDRETFKEVQMSEVIHIKGNFDEEVLQSSVPVLVDFGAEWCGPCVRLAPFIQELANDFSGRAKVVEVDVDVNQELATQYGVMSIPTLIVFKDGEQVQKWVGFTQKETLAQGLEEALK